MRNAGDCVLCLLTKSNEEKKIDFIKKIAHSSLTSERLSRELY